MLMINLTNIPPTRLTAMPSDLKTPIDTQALVLYVILSDGHQAMPSRL